MAVSFEGKTALVANIDHGDGMRKSGLDVTVTEAGRDLPEKL